MRTSQLILSTLLAFSALTFASDKTSPVDKSEQQPPASLSELATRADLVALVQVMDTDYVYTRSFPSEGSAFLKILIAYKASRPDQEIIEIYEKGLHSNECYFENPTVFEEGRRYLVFFRSDPQDPELYRGLAEGCALEIFVSKDNRYVLKYPIEGLELADRLNALAMEFDFNDYHALTSEESLAPAERDDLLERGLLVPYQDQFKYTHGIDLTVARKLINAEALKSRKNWSGAR